MSLGDTLRAAREKAGLSVDDIMHATQMTRDQVVGLEADDYHAFSAPVYTKGFIKLFARAVGVPAQPLVATYLANPNGTEKNDPSREMPVVALETISAESGALVSVRPAVPHPVPADAPVPAPEEKKAAAPAPAPVAAPPEKKVAAAPVPAPAPAPVPAPAETTLLDFMAPAPAPLPEKRIAPVEPGLLPPEPPSKLVRFDDPAPKPAPAPVAKSAPEPTAVGSATAVPYWNEVAPPVAPQPVGVPAVPFVFPGPSAPRPRRPEPAPEAASAPEPEKKVSPEPDPRIAAAPHPVVSSAVRPAFVEDDLFAPPERGPETPAAAGPLPDPLFPDEDPGEAPDAPNAVSVFFANVRAALTGRKARRLRPALLGLAGIVVLAAFVGLIASLFSGGGEPPAGPDAPVDEAFFPPEPHPLADGPVEIVPVLPAPRSFAK